VFAIRFFNSFKYTSFLPTSKGRETALEVRLTTLKAIETLFNHFLPLFPTDSAIFTLGRVYASLSLLGSQSSANECIEISVFAWLACAPVELAIDPMGATDWAVSV
jgi:hypothetical protein